MGYERLIFWIWGTQGKKRTFNFLIICIYFLPNLLKDSQTITLTIHFFQTPPLREANLRWLVDLI